MMKYRLIPLLSFLCLCLIAVGITPSYGQFGGTKGVKKEGRFTVDLTNERSNNANPFEVDEPGLMKGFDLHLQWWTLLGEPMEHYDFRWHAADEYQIDGIWVRRSALEKYPDLLKRYDNIRPIKVNLSVGGSFGGLPETVKTPPELLTPFYSGYTYKSPESTGFKYRINDIRLMRAKSGKWGKGITPTSPKDWEYFLQYKVFINKNSPTLWSLVTDNTALNNTAELTEQELELRRNQLKQLFTKANEVSLNVKLAHLEWPMTELRAIAEKYKKYESGEEEPLPSEVVAERLKEEAENLEEYKKDDFWSEPEIFEEPTLVILKKGEHYGIKNSNSQVLIEAIYPKEWAFKIIMERYVTFITRESINKNPGPYKYDNCWRNSLVLMNSRGEMPIANSFFNAVEDDSGNLVILRSLRCEKKPNWDALVTYEEITYTPNFEVLSRSTHKTTISKYHDYENSYSVLPKRN